MGSTRIRRKQPAGALQLVLATMSAIGTLVGGPQFEASGNPRTGLQK